MEGQLQSARQARKMIRLVRNQLLSPTPDTFKTCSGPLGEAIAALGRIEGELSSRDRHDPVRAHTLRDELKSLRRELSEVNALMRAAGSFYEGYGRLLGGDPDAVELDYGSGRSLAGNANRLIAHG